MKNSIKKALLVIGILVVAGCAGPKQVEKRAAVFYPDPPDLPRVQFLVSYTGAKDLEPERSAFDTFITGGKETEKRLDKPYGVAIYDGQIFVCDTNATVMVFDLKTRKLEPLHGAQGLGKLMQPLNIAIDGSGNKYVADPVRGQVVVFDRNGFYVTAFGEPAKWKPVDVEVFDTQLYVADMKNAQIVVLDKATGAQVNSFGQKGEPSERLYKPNNITFDSKGILYVSDTGKFQIVKFDRDGHWRGAVGQLGNRVGEFARPRGLASDRNNRIYAVDAAFDNVQIFTDEGVPLMFFGKAGRGPGDMYLPAKVTVDYDNVKYFERYADPQFEIEHLIIVTNQFGNSMVNVYGFGREKGKQYPTDEEIRKMIEEKQEKLRREREKSVKPVGGDKEKSD